MDWYDFIKSIPEDILKNAFIYADPPYENTSKYQVNSMDYEKFWSWFRDCPYPVYVSSYSAPEDIKPLNFTHKISLLSSNSRKKTVENIYYNGAGQPVATLHDLLYAPQKRDILL